MELEKIKQIVEASLMVAAGPLSFDRLYHLFAEDGERAPSRDDLRTALEELENDYHHSGIQLVNVASGYRFQARAEVADWINRLWDEKRPRYSRALLETLAIVAYRQPITRGEIENIRGVAVSTNIMRTLLEREWLRIVGHRDVPGKPAVYATTKQFLDYFNLASLAELPSLAELKDVDDVNTDLFADMRAADADDEASADDAENATDESLQETPNAAAVTDENEAAGDGAHDDVTDVAMVDDATREAGEGAPGPSTADNGAEAAMADAAASTDEESTEETDPAAPADDAESSDTPAVSSGSG